MSLVNKNPGPNQKKEKHVKKLNQLKKRDKKKPLIEFIIIY